MICEFKGCRWEASAIGDANLCIFHSSDREPKPEKPSGFIFDRYQRWQYNYKVFEYDMDQFEMWFATHRDCKCIHYHKCHKMDLLWNKLFKKRSLDLFDELQAINKVELDRIVNRPKQNDK